MMLTALAKMQQDREVAVDLSEVQCPICLSVLVEPYPGSVMSVWVYVASIVRRR